MIKKDGVMRIENAIERRSHIINIQYEGMACDDTISIMGKNFTLFEVVVGRGFCRTT